MVTISSGHNQGKPTGRKKIKRHSLVQKVGIAPPTKKRCIRCSFPGCSHTEKRKNNMDDRILLSTKMECITCSCTKIFLSKRAKVNHIRTIHQGIKRKKGKYEDCDFSTNDYGKYLPHLFTDHGEGEQLKCLHC